MSTERLRGSRGSWASPWRDSKSQGVTVEAEGGVRASSMRPAYWHEEEDDRGYGDGLGRYSGPPGKFLFSIFLFCFLFLLSVLIY